MKLKVTVNGIPYDIDVEVQEEESMPIIRSTSQKARFRQSAVSCPHDSVLLAATQCRGCAP